MIAMMALLLASATSVLPNRPLRCELHSAAPPPQRVELYTSEGCSSCPPADRWLSALPVRDDRIVLAFHVDYWNELGWPDRFADARYSGRQRRIAARAGSRTVYTPAVFVEGAEFRSWRSRLPANPPGQVHELSATLSLDTRAVAVLDAQVPYPASATAHLALTEDALSSAIGAGENRGLQLRHDHVVRAYAGPKALTQPLQVDVPADLDRSRSRVLIWIEDADGRTLQALSRPLGACAMAP